MNQKTLLTLLFALWLPAFLQGQTIRISGRVTDASDQPLPNCTAMLFGADSSFVAGVISDTDGRYQLEISSPGSYLLELTMLGFEKQTRTLRAASEPIEIEKIVLKESAVALGGVTVTAYKQAVRFAPGKMTIDLGSTTLAAGGDVFEALKNMPGVGINEDGTVSLGGQSGAQVLVDGKPTYLSGENLVNLLRSMPASSVKNIELITHPSARYDAAGNSGVINLQTNRHALQGVDLSVHSRYTQGRYARGDAGFNLAYRNRRVKVFTDYSFYDGKEYNDLHVRRKDANPAHGQTLEESMYQDTYRTWNSHSHYYRLGIDYEGSDKLSLGAYTSGYLTNEALDGQMNAGFTPGSAPADSALFTHNRNHKNPRSYSGGANLLYKPRPHTEWKTYFDWVLHQQPENQLQYSEFQKPAQTRRDTLKGDMEGTIHIYALESNLSFPIGKTRWSAGAKSSYITVDNAARYQDLLEGEWLWNTGLSKEFSYEENINAAYIQTEAQLNSRLALYAGLRMENTNLEGKVYAQQGDSSYTQHYTHLFPTASLEYTFPSGHALSVLFARRINRPNYQDMNPFVYIFDDYLHEKGNPDLKPALSNHLQVSFAWKDRGQVSLFYLWIKDPIVKSFHREGTDRMLVYPANLSSRHAAGLRMQTALIRPTAWWQLNGSFSLNYGKYGWTFENGTEENSFVTPVADLNNRFELGKTWTIELRASYRGKASEGQAVGKPLFVASGGIRKTLFDGKGTVALAVDDLFRSGLIRGTTGMPGRRYESRERAQGRLLHLSFTYRFRLGEGIKSSLRKEKTEEEKRIR